MISLAIGRFLTAVGLGAFSLLYTKYLLTNKPNILFGAFYAYSIIFSFGFHYFYNYICLPNTLSCPATAIHAYFQTFFVA